MSAAQDDGGCYVGHTRSSSQCSVQLGKQLRLLIDGICRSQPAKM